MAKSKQFIKSLDKQFRIHTSWLRSAVGRKRPGRPTKTNKSRVHKALKKLESLAREIITKERAKREFAGAIQYRRRWHPKKNKGWDRLAKKKKFGEWYKSEIVTPHSIYVFWKNHRCLYIGRTVGGKGRPQSHFSKHWFNQASRIDVCV